MCNIKNTGDCNSLCFCKCVRGLEEVLVELDCALEWQSNLLKSCHFLIEVVPSLIGKKKKKEGKSICQNFCFDWIVVTDNFCKVHYKGLWGSNVEKQ